VPVTYRAESAWIGEHGFVKIDNMGRFNSAGAAWVYVILFIPIGVLVAGVGVGVGDVFDNLLVRYPETISQTLFIIVLNWSFLRSRLIDTLGSWSRCGGMEMSALLCEEFGNVEHVLYLLCLIRRHRIFLSISLCSARYEGNVQYY
jgi:hypothetical protein